MQKFLINYGENTLKKGKNVWGEIVPGHEKLIQCPVRVSGFCCISCWMLAKGESVTA